MEGLDHRADEFAVASPIEVLDCCILHGTFELLLHSASGTVLYTNALKFYGNLEIRADWKFSSKTMEQLVKLTFLSVS